MQKYEISPHDRFFSTDIICDICDKYEVWSLTVEDDNSKLVVVVVCCYLNAHAEKSVDDRLVAVKHLFTIWVQLAKFWSNLRVSLMLFEAVTFRKSLCHGQNLINLEY